MRYAIRCITEMGKFTELIKHQPAAQLFTTAVPATVTTAMTADADTIRDWAALKDAMALEAQIAAKNDYKEIVVKKLIAGGMIQFRIRELVQKEDRKGTEILDIVDLIDQEEKRNNHNHTAVKPKPKNAHAIEESQVEDDEDEASAVNQRRPFTNRGGWRGRPRGNQGNPNRGQNRYTPPPADRKPCSYCGLMSHTLQFCYTAPQEIKDEDKKEPPQQDHPTATSAISTDFSSRLSYSENF